MIEIKLHDIGEGMTEGEVLHYYVKEGDEVKPDQPLIEVQTDKMTAEIPAPKAGVIQKILVETGTTVSVGTTLLTMAENNSVEKNKTASAPSEKKRELPSAIHMVHMPNPFQADSPQTQQMTKKRKAILAAPYTRKIARENGVNIEEIVGTGPAGRITDADVYDYISKKNNPDFNSTVVAEKTTVEISHTKQNDMFHSKPSKQSIAVSSSSSDEEVEVIPFRGRRKQIAKKMSQSLFTIPHVTHFEEVDMTELINFRTELKELGQHISVVAFFIKALQLSLKDFPIFNAKLDTENEVIRLEKNYHIGIATDTAEGLIVPVIRQVENKTLSQIHTEMKNLTEKAQKGVLTVKEITGGTFTISNVGPFGSVGATPIINLPEVGLMAFHKTKEMPVVRNKEIVIRSIMNVSFVFDHRVSDGLTAVKFTNRFKELIENPKLMMLELM